MSIAARRNASLILFIALLVGATLPGCQSDDPTQPESAAPGTISVSSEPSDINAPWFLLRAEQLIQEGSGADVLNDMPSGDYSLVWGPVSGWASPTPNPSSASLAAGSEIAFSATYTEFVEETGSIAIDTNPDEINAPWTLYGPNGFMTQGTGDRLFLGREPGQYVLEFGSVQDYDGPAQQAEGELLAGNRLDLGGNYIYNAPATEGAIMIDVTPENVSWSISGPGLNTSGSGDAEYTQVATGEYTIQWQDLPGYIAPDPSEMSRVVEDGETELFQAVYRDPNGPSIAGVGPDNRQGDLMTISGSSFGTHTRDIEWTGAWIEQQADGTNPDTKPGWEHVYQSHGPRDHITSRRAWSGNKAIDTTIDQSLTPTSWESTLGFQRGPFQKIYASFWFYIDPIYQVPGTVDPSVGTGFKFLYLTCNGCNHDMEVNAPTNGFMFNMGYPKGSIVPNTNVVQNFSWITCPGMYTPIYDVFLDAKGVGYDLADPGLTRVIVSRGGPWNPIYAPRSKAWTRVEIYVDRGPVPDQPTGEVMFAVTHPGEGRYIGLWATDMVGHTARSDCRSEPAPWEKFVFQNFFDDPRNPGNEKCEMVIDDVYLQFGTRARVEFGDAPVFEQCTVLETQVVDQWSADSVSVRVNRGRFSPGQTVYAFVIRDDETVSAGYPVVLQ